MTGLSYRQANRCAPLRRRAFCATAAAALSSAAQGHVAAALKEYAVLVCSKPMPAQNTAYNHWYNTRHLPEMLNIPGFRSASRLFVVKSGSPASNLPPYFALYDVKSADISQTNEEVMRRMRNGDLSHSNSFDYKSSVTLTFQAMGPTVDAAKVPGSLPPMVVPNEKLQRYDLLVLSNPVDGQEEAYNRWYETEHVFDVLRNPGFKSARRFKLSSAYPTTYNSPRYLAIFQFLSADIDQTAAEIVRRLKSGQTRPSHTFDMSTAQIYYARQFAYRQAV